MMMMIGLDMAWMGSSAKLSNHVVSLTSDYFTDLSVGGQSKAEHIQEKKVSWNSRITIH